MVKVCDSIMGSGKSSAAINYMLEHKDTERFIYVTPFLDETERIQEACAGMDFQLPSAKGSGVDYRKRTHLQQLIEERHNVAITHALLATCNNEIADIIRDNEYTVIIDEAIDIFNQVDIKKTDLDVLMRCGYLSKHYINDSSEISYYERQKEFEYEQGAFSKIFMYSENKRLLCMSDKGNVFCCWEFNPCILTAAKEVIILTYLFEHTPMRCLMEINHIAYGHVYVQKTNDSKYRFVNYPTPQPEYVKDLPNLIHVCEDDKLNDIGKMKTALSYSWIKSQAKLSNNGKLDILRKKLNTFFRVRCAHLPSSNRMWSTFKLGEKYLCASGFIKSFLSYNCRAVNGLRNKQALAYLVNIFVNPNLKRYLYENNVTINDDGYALHTMIQWIWRSAIRDGKEIWIYVPSKRMRTLLQNWIQEVSSDNANEHHANTLDA